MLRGKHEIYHLKFFGAQYIFVDSRDDAQQISGAYSPYLTETVCPLASNISPPPL